MNAILNKHKTPKILGNSIISRSMLSKSASQSTLSTPVPSNNPAKPIKTIDLLREGWSDRIFRDVASNKTIYYWDYPFKWFGAHAYFRRKGRTGPIVMTASRKPFSSGVTIYFVDETEVTMELRSYMGLFSRSYFEFKGKRYRWDGTASLRDTENGELVAQFDRSFVGAERDGRLEVFKAGKDMIDLIVATLMMLLHKGHDNESI